MISIKNIINNIKEVVFSIIKFCIRVKSTFLNIMFEKKKYYFVLKIYNIINSLKTLAYRIIEIFFCKNMDGHKNKHANCYKISTVKEFCNLNGYKYFVVEEEQWRDVCIPEYFYDKEGETVLKFKSPEMYIAEIKDVEIIGENSMVISKEYCLYDIAKRDKDNRYDLRFKSVKNIDGESTIVECIHSNTEISKAISLIGFASFNYYHFMIEIISRMQYIDKFEEYASVPVLVDEKALKIPQYKEVLEMVNVKNHPILPVKKSHAYLVRELIFPSYNSWMPINIKKGTFSKPEDFLIAKSSIEYLKITILNGINQVNLSSNRNRKIFISRRNAKNTRLVNEDVIVRIAQKYKFEVVYPEELTFMQQVNLFSEAEYVVGSTGAAFTNIIFCPTNAKIVCIIPKKYRFYGYSTIAKAVGLQCIFLDAQVTKERQASSMETYRIDEGYFESCLDKIIFK